MDKLTSQFQQALADAQSVAIGRDHQIMEPAHVMLIALLDSQGGTVRPLLIKAGADVNKLRSELACAARQAAEGRGRSGRGACLERLDAAAEHHRQARAAARRSVHLERAFRARGVRGQGTSARILKDCGVVRGAVEKAIDEVRGGEKVTDANAEEQRGRSRNTRST
jgi:ATP-dependent Clp protease ATP-binding subunit ClpB